MRILDHICLFFLATTLATAVLAPPADAGRGHDRGASHGDTRSDSDSHDDSDSDSSSDSDSDSRGDSDTDTPGDRARRVLLSTDVATGLIDTHGGQSGCPSAPSASATGPTASGAASQQRYGRLDPAGLSHIGLASVLGDTLVAPQDIDDGLALSMALNLDADGILDLLAVVPTYGNASQPAQMLVARQIVRRNKRRRDIPIVPGATSPASQTLHNVPQWFDGTDVPVEGRKGSFVAACRNQGVALMRERIASSDRPVTLLAIGPFTDIACLLNTTPKHVLANLEEIIAIASRVEGESLLVNGKVVNDFNSRLDPTAVALALGARHTEHIRIRLMSFSLTGQTSQEGDVIAFDAATYPGPPDPTPVSEASFEWLLAAAGPRNTFWSGIFGTPEGPFDQYAVVAAIQPELFECHEARAYIQQCPFPEWSPDFPGSNGIPYNDADNPCTDHGPTNGASLSQIPAQLVVTLDTGDDGPLVRGTTGIDGNIPQLDRPARRVTACIDFAGAAARQEFENVLKRYTW